MPLDDEFIGRNLLSPDERNIYHLLQAIQRLHQAVPASVGKARRPGADGIGYAERETHWNIPRAGRDDSTLAETVQEVFAGGVQWHNPLAMINVTPSPLFAGVAAMTMANLYNQNALWDFTSGAALQVERKMVMGLGRILADYGPRSGGIGTSGGKAAMTYAIKLAINRIEPEAVVHGVRKRHVVFASACAHYSIEWTLNQLGLGSAACTRIPCDSTGRMRAAALETRLRRAVAEGYCVSAIILAGGDTIDHIVDPIDEVVEMIDALLSTMKLTYRPFIYVDLVSGWIWRLFRGYDFSANDLSLSSADARYVRHKLAELASLSHVDGIGVDLHKLGLCPYGSSFFLCREGAELLAINGAKRPLGEVKFGELHAHHFTFENSRTTAGIAAAWATLNQLGLDGLRAYAVKLMNISGMVLQALAEWPDDFTVLPRPECWRVPLFTLRFHGGASASDTDVRRFHAVVSSLVQEGAVGVPLIGLVPEYKLEGFPARPVLMAYPMSLFMTQSSARAAVMSLVEIKRRFRRGKPMAVAHLDPDFHLPPR